MDFGDILKKWEKQSTGNTGSGPEDANGVYEKDTEAGGRRTSTQEKRRRLRNKKPDAELDIHGLTRDEAWQAMDVFFGEAKEKGHEKVLIIHGKGNHTTGESVLKRAVGEFIEHCPFAGESGRGKAAAGGEGATWVLLKEVPGD